MQPDYLRIALALLVSLGVAVAAIWLLSRKGWAQRLGPRQAPGRIEILDTRAVGPRNTLVALRFAGREALVLVGPSFANTVIVADTAGPAQPPPDEPAHASPV